MLTKLKHGALGKAIELSLLFLVGGVLILNQWHMVAIHNLLPAAAAGGGTAGASAQPSKNSTAGADMLPHGVPARYGAELKVSFDDAAGAMPILENFDRGAGAITLTGQLEQRYIAIASQTACEFCCGAKTLVFPDGKPACACAHSAAMRGLARYLLLKYPEMPDSEILTEVNRWKAAFFPGPTVQKASRSATNQTPGASGSLPSQVGGC
ncbi:MAG: hypothetical protein HY973_00680 [Candidatus Kerfeldbacteria bacterium]|nr:hypothetical protein [Candidatus Kerfeldbacteria bacterium]